MNGRRNARQGKRQLPLPLPHRVGLNGEDFLVSPCNSEAVRWIDSWPQWPGPAIAIAGPPGSGKTHLASVWAASSGARFVGAESLAAGGAAIAGEGPLILDGVDRTMGRAELEESLFHLLNRFQGRKGALLLTGTQPPARWPIALPDLASRLGVLPVGRIAPPDDELMEGLLVKLFHDRQIAVGAGVIRFMAARMERSFEAARILVEQSDSRALAEGRPVTIPLVREILDGAN